MTIPGFFALLQTLDAAFKMGGRLLDGACERCDELKEHRARLPDLTEMDGARAGAVKRAEARDHMSDDRLDDPAAPPRSGR